MKRLYMTVEGQTEAAFASQVLARHLARHNVFLLGTRFVGLHSRRQGRIPRGGISNTCAHFLRDVGNWMKQDRHSEARFTMMIDLYGLPIDCPGYEAAVAKASGRARAETLEQALVEYFDDQRFIPYLQCHEFEALVLAEPARIAGLYPRLGGHRLTELLDDCARFPGPEDINDGHYSHPKYRILKAEPNYEGSVAGPLLAEEIGLDALRKRCPHFGQWLAQLEGLDG